MNSSNHEVEAVVVAVGDGHAVVRASAGGCPRCAAGKGCGAGVFTAAAKPREIDVPLPPGDDLRIGQTVSLGLSSASLGQAAWLAYGLPLAGVLLASAATAVLGGGDAFGIIAAGAGLVIGIGAGRWLSRRASCVRRMRVTVLERAPG